MNNNLRMLRTDTESMYRMAVLSSLALEALIESNTYLRNGDLDTSRKLLAIAWAYNSKQEFIDGMKICNRKLISSGVNESELPAFQNYGLDIVRYVTDLTDSVSEVLGDRPTFKFSPPF